MDSIQTYSLSSFCFSIPSNLDLKLWLSYRKLCLPLREKIFLFPLCVCLKINLLYNVVKKSIRLGIDGIDFSFRSPCKQPMTSRVTMLKLFNHSWSEFPCLLN